MGNYIISRRARDIIVDFTIGEFRAIPPYEGQTNWYRVRGRVKAIQRLSARWRLLLSNESGDVLPVTFQELPDCAVADFVEIVGPARFSYKLTKEGRAVDRARKKAVSEQKFTTIEQFRKFVDEYLKAHPIPEPIHEIRLLGRELVVLYK